MGQESMNSDNYFNYAVPRRNRKEGKHINYEEEADWTSWYCGIFTWLLKCDV